MTDPTPHCAANLDVALAAYQDEWQKIENERGEYIPANERHRAAMEMALLAVYRNQYGNRRV